VRGRAPSRRRVAWSTWLTGLLLLAAAVAGLALIARSQGWLAPEAPGRAGAPPGTVAVPAAAVAIPAYTRVRLAHLVDPATSALRAVYLPEGSILPDTFVDAKQVIGRVLAAEKAPGQLFSESDFFPPGTREGIVAGIPPGKRAMRIDASKVNGIVGLGRGDRFDLVATFDLASGRSGAVSVERSGVSELGALGSQTRAMTVVEGGAVVQPLERRVVPGQRQRVVDEMVIAVATDEVAALSEALHTGARIDCVPRSGRPDDASDEGEGVGASAKPRLRVIETIEGGKRRALAVPQATGG